MNEWMDGWMDGVSASARMELMFGCCDALVSCSGFLLVPERVLDVGDVSLSLID